jgi:O-antigen ligase
MTKRLYTKRAQKRTGWSLMTGLMGWLFCGWLLWSWEPDRWWKEAVVLMIAGWSLAIFSSWLWGNKKTGIITAVGITGLLILNRLGILDMVSVVLLMTVLGLITLVN